MPHTSKSNIMSIREMIDTAFGDPRMNVVNHKLIHTILIILARQLRLLERRVEVEIGPNHHFDQSSSVSITEIKLEANIHRKRKLLDNSGANNKEAGRNVIDGLVSTGKPEKGLSSGKTFIDKVSQEKTMAEKSLKKQTTANNLPPKMNYRSHLEEIEEKREKEIRVIHQRANSREEHTKTPTPMASLNSMEKQYEKLLIVEHVPTDESKSTERSLQVGAHGKVQRLSIVTKKEFDDLSKAVKDIQEKFGFTSDFGLMEHLREGASLTNAMAALQLSARLEAAEKTLERIISLLTDLASTRGVSTKPALKVIEGIGNTELIFESKKTMHSTMATLPPDANFAINNDQPATRKSKKVVNKDTEQTIDKRFEDNTDWVSAQQLASAICNIREELLKIVNMTAVNSNSNANNALTIARKLEEKLTDSLSLGDRMLDLEKIVSNYADQVNALDTGLSSQVTTYQEQLTQMQHDLENSIETMQEALANAGGDTTLIAEVNNQFNALQNDLDVTSMRQNDLKDMQDNLANQIESLRNMIEILRESKADRDEVVDALRDKAGLASLNGLVSRIEFEAVRSDLQKRIVAAYDKFNNQEIVWQKAIDELLRNLNDKTDYAQVASLEESIRHYLEKFQNKINGLLEIVGEAHAAAISRKLYRETACLSCSTPAHLNLESQTMPKIPAFPSLRHPVEESEAKPELTDENIQKPLCFSGLPIPHHIDKSSLCRRYCGGSHTVFKDKLVRIPTGVQITPALKETITTIGLDGKTYMVDGAPEKHPCGPCNIPTEAPLPSVTESNPGISVEKSSDTLPSDYRQQSFQNIVTHKYSGVSVTPPPPINED